ncbi:MAG: hypothetical protein ACKER6_00685 [Candidatus Hodgkinia cicadicola]
MCEGSPVGNLDGRPCGPPFMAVVGRQVKQVRLGCGERGHPFDVLSYRLRLDLRGTAV